MSLIQEKSNWLKKQFWFHISNKIAYSSLSRYSNLWVSNIANGERIAVVIRFVDGSQIREILVHIVSITGLHERRLNDTVTSILLANNKNVVNIVHQTSRVSTMIFKKI